MDHHRPFPKLISHQGLRVNGIKNTIPAFLAAVAAKTDMIEMDIANRALNLLIPDEELQERIQNWTPPPPRVNDGFLTVYARLANPAAKGAGINLRLE